MTPLAHPALDGTIAELLGVMCKGVCFCRVKLWLEVNANDIDNTPHSHIWKSHFYVIFF